jgi:Tol biopolymer transport system component/DNA-binding winged helix-turn-helix (wHTH) protein
VKLKLSGRPFQVLVILLEQHGQVVTREQLQQRLWPDTFVDVDHNLNTAINKIREVLGDEAESPRYVETLPRRGYRFIAPVEGAGLVEHPRESPNGPAPKPSPSRGFVLRLLALIGACVLVGVAGLFLYTHRHVATSPRPHALTRITFDAGLQIGATWSPDGRFVAYESDRGGKSDIWVQQISGGDPVQVTKGPGQHWQPDWSPDGSYIAYRSEEGEGGLYFVPALGGDGQQRRIASFGYYPRWSPDSSQILFQRDLYGDLGELYVVGLNGNPPREVLTELLQTHPELAKSAVWHPDGKRITIETWRDDAPIPDFWTVSLSGGDWSHTQLDPQILGRIEEISGDRFEGGRLEDRRFSWAPSGSTIYFERSFRGARNLWKMSVDPQTLRAVAAERLTTGAGQDTDMALSADGKKLAFTIESRHLRVWLFPSRAGNPAIAGDGRAVTSTGMDALLPALTRDGNRLAFVAVRGGRWELWQKSLLDGREAPLFADSFHRGFPQWSPDGTKLTYWRGESWRAGERQQFVWYAENRSEEALNAPSASRQFVYDWSSNGEGLLATRPAIDSNLVGEIWLLPATPVSDTGPPAQKITSTPKYNLWQPHLSPDVKWIVFEAEETSTGRATGSTLYVVPATGGRWTRITDGKYWDDKPRWSPDGKAIFFVSGRGGFFNVWRLGFDPSTGKPVGEASRVTAFETPSFMIPIDISSAEISIAQDKFVMNMEERSGGIWVLDNVD